MLEIYHLSVASTCDLICCQDKQVICLICEHCFVIQFEYIDAVFSSLIKSIIVNLWVQFVFYPVHTQFCSHTIERKKRRQRLNSLRLRPRKEDDGESSTDEEAAKLDRALARARQAEENEKRIKEQQPFFMQDGDEQHEFHLSEIYQFATQGQYWSDKSDSNSISCSRKSF